MSEWVSEWSFMLVGWGCMRAYCVRVRFSNFLFVCICVHLKKISVQCTHIHHTHTHIKQHVVYYHAIRFSELAHSTFYLLLRRVCFCMFVVVQSMESSTKRMDAVQVSTMYTRTHTHIWKQMDINIYVFICVYTHTLSSQFRSFRLFLTLCVCPFFHTSDELFYYFHYIDTFFPYFFFLSFFSWFFAFLFYQCEKSRFIRISILFFWMWYNSYRKKYFSIPILSVFLSLSEYVCF